ncbi:LrgB family protein [Halonatronum saccharophilum]|uniref:LrgB family protein n=1 Tax=Halonatronum saccharophilum TaxID=150060 RepID=UPI000488CED6|nr:LrgB family protein [Halonatronum saccharophilum]
MDNILDTPYFGLLISIISFEIGLFLYNSKKVAILNPLLISVTMIILFLTGFNIDLNYYNQGGDLIAFFLGPATVILALPLYRQINLLKKNLFPILAGVIVGVSTAVVSVKLLGNLFGLSEVIQLSLMPKSITTPIGIEVSSQIGGIPSITVAAIVVAGILGAVVGPWILMLFKIDDQVAVGISLGTASHALGTTKAMELGEKEGAMSSLAIGVAGLLTVVLIPLLLLVL